MAGKVKLPMGIEDFEEMRTMGYYYADKTGLIKTLLEHFGKVSLFTRPRRFGKTLNMSMLKHFFETGSDGTLFDGLEIARDQELCEEYMGKFPVIAVSLKNAASDTMDGAMELLRNIIGKEALRFSFLLESSSLTEMECRRYKALIQVDDNGIFTMKDQLLGDSLLFLSNCLYKHYGQKTIILIDEYDVPLDKAYHAGYYDAMVDFIRTLFGQALKTNSSLYFAVLTGCLRISKESIFTGLNNFNVYTVNDVQYNEYFGFSDMEVRKMLAFYGFMEKYETIREWYDGYRFRRLRHIYNPRSVVAAMTSGYFSNYWTSTETYEALKVYMDMDFQGLRTDIVQMLGGGCIRVNTRSFQNDMRTFRTKDDVLTLLIHLGYLGFDAETEEAFIPNKEIAGEFENAMSTGGWPEVMRVLQMSEKLLEDTLRCDEKSVAQGLDRAHMEAASILAYNDENSLSCAIGLAYYSAKKDYKLIRELPAGRGFADIVFLPLPFRKKPALIVELKYNKSADSAIWQIKNRHYAKALEGYCGEILLVGISYDRNCADKPHSCVIEKLMYGTGCQD